MRAIEWHRYLLEQRERHGKMLFSVSELANIGSTTPAALNLALIRLVAGGVLARYVRAWYGLPGQVDIDHLIRAIDGGAYITSTASLYRHGLITQIPMQTLCFTNRRYNRARERRTPLGTLVFACVQRPIYDPPPDGEIRAPAAQALFDFVYISRRDGVDPQSNVTFRNIRKVNSIEIARIGGRYPSSVRRQVEAIVAAG